jgi:hypothetical protein
MGPCTSRPALRTTDKVQVKTKTIEYVGKLPWDLWLHVAAWLELKDCFLLARLSSDMQSAHTQDPLSPVELDLSRVERAGLRALRLDLWRWKALRVLDLGNGTLSDGILGSGSQFHYATNNYNLTQLRYISPSLQSTGRPEAADIDAPLIVKSCATGEYGTLCFPAVQIGTAFSATWYLPDFLDMGPEPVSSPSFRALGHDWSGLVYPRGNSPMAPDCAGWVSAYIKNDTVATSARYGAMTCQFRIMTLASDSSFVYTDSEEWTWRFGSFPYDRGFHYAVHPEEVPSALRDGALVLRFEVGAFE